MKTKIHLISVLLGAAILPACSGPTPAQYSAPEFSSVKPVELEIVSGGIGQGRALISGLFPYEQHLVIVYAGTFGHFVELYDLSSNSVVSSCVRFGDGEYDMIHCHGTSIDYGSGMLYLYDYSTAKMLQVDLDKWMREGAEDCISRVDIASIASHAEEIYCLPDGWLVMNGFPKKYQGSDCAPRFEVYDRNLNLVASNNERVDVGEIERLTLYVFPPIAFDPAGNSWYVVSSYGGIWESFQMSDKGIRRFSIKYFYPSDMETHLNDYYGSSTVHGFHDICFHEGRIYCVSDFENTLRDVLSSDFGGVTYADITVFDREGNPQECYKTQFEIEKICFDGETLYALVDGKDGELHIAKYDFRGDAAIVE